MLTDAQRVPLEKSIGLNSSKVKCRLVAISRESISVGTTHILEMRCAFDFQCRFGANAPKHPRMHRCVARIRTEYAELQRLQTHAKVLQISPLVVPTID